MNHIKIDRNELEFVCCKHDSPQDQNQIKVNMHIDICRSSKHVSVYLYGLCVLYSQQGERHKMKDRMWSKEEGAKT